MISSFALHPTASKYLIAQAVAKMPQVQKAFQNGKIFIGLGTTNMLVAEALLGKPIDPPEAFVAGVITQKTACVTEPEVRLSPLCINRGEVIQTDWIEFVNTFEEGDLFIKGANAVDPFGRAGILIADPQGGTIGKAMGILKAKGIEIICPVGLEKMIPSCELAEKHMGITRTGPRLGFKLGYISVSNATLVTEIESIQILFGLNALQIAAGGVQGMEGSVVLAVESDDEEKLMELIHYMKKANQRPPITIKKKLCAQCASPCQFCEK
jgi:hypothetical protein